MPTIAFVTSAEYSGLTDDDRLVLPLLAERGIGVIPAVWDDDRCRWESFDAIIVRSPWDYYHKPDAFLSWIRELEQAGAPLWNPPAILRWNFDKSYLLELASKGILIPRTRHFGKGSSASLTTVLKEEGWKEAVVKPIVSASGFNTWLTTPDRAAMEEERFQGILGERGALVQEFRKEIRTDGEWAFVFFNNEFSHAALKRPSDGDFRVQTHYGGTVNAASPPASFVAQAREIINTVGENLLYARIDGISAGGRIMLMELEVLEPSLYLAQDSRAPGNFARAIIQLLGSEERRPCPKL